MLVVFLSLLLLCLLFGLIGVFILILNLTLAVRARVGLANMARQRALAVSPDSAVVCATVSETISVSSPAQTSHSMLTHSTPVSYSSPHARLTPSTAPYLQSLECSRLLNAPSQYLNILYWL